MHIKLFRSFSLCSKAFQFIYKYATMLPKRPKIAPEHPTDIADVDNNAPRILPPSLINYFTVIPYMQSRYSLIYKILQQDSQ